MKDPRYEFPVAGLDEEQLAADLKSAMRQMVARFPRAGIVLFVTDVNTTKGGVGYIANVERADAQKMVEDWLERSRKLS